jgi:hypothetical protein
MKSETTGLPLYGEFCYKGDPGNRIPLATRREFCEALEAGFRANRLRPTFRCYGSGNDFHTLSVHGNFGPRHKRVLTGVLERYNLTSVPKD